MAIGGVVIQFVAETGKAVRSIGNLTSSLGKVDDQSGKAHKAFKGVHAAWLAAIPVAGAVAAGAVELASGLWDAAQASIEDRKQADTLAKTLKTIPGITQAMIDKNSAWIDSMELATTVSDTELRSAIGKLTLATGDLGKAQELTTLAVDTAAGSHKNLTTVVDALAKAADGNTSALKRQFPWLDKNHDGTVSLKEATEGLKGAFDGAAKSAANNDPFKRLGVVFDQLKEAIGNALVPLIDKFGKWISDKKNQKKIEELIGKVQELASSFGTDLVNAIKDAMDWLKDPKNQEKLKTWATNIGHFADAVGHLIGEIQTLIYWFNKLPNQQFFNWLARVTAGHPPGPGSWSATPTASTIAASSMAAPAYYTPPVVNVTEEEIYRAVSRLVMRGDTRNGRRARIA